MSREQDFITEARASARKVWEGVNELKTLQTEWNALDYATTLDDGDGENTGVTAAEVGSAVFDSADALLTTFSAGHATNLAKLL